MDVADMVNVRTEIIGTRVSLSERATLARAARILGLPLSTFLRTAATAAAACVTPPTLNVDGTSLPLIPPKED